MLTWRDSCERVGIAAFAADVLGYLTRLFMSKAIYQGHDQAAVICAWIGFLVSLAAPVLVVIGTQKRLKIPIATGGLVMAYVWFSDVAWWVMVK
jgi:hypothetical protein